MIYLTLIAYLAIALLIACLWAAIDATDGKHDHPGYYLARAIVWPVMLAMWLVEFIALNTNPSSKRRWKGKPDKAAPVPAVVPSAPPVRRTPQVAATPQRQPTPATRPTEPNATGGRGGINGASVGRQAATGAHRYGRFSSLHDRADPVSSFQPATRTIESTCPIWCRSSRAASNFCQ